MIVQRVAARSGPHFLGATGNRVHGGPATLRGLPIRSANIRSEVERVIILAFTTMGVQVELGDEVFNVEVLISCTDRF